MTWGEIQKISLEKMFAKDEPINVSKIDTLKQDGLTEMDILNNLYFGTLYVNMDGIILNMKLYFVI